MKVITIIGQKNVGKSSLFNLFAKSDSSTSINYSGYTRDCLFSNVKIGSHIYKIYDTPGLGYEKNEIDFLALKKSWNIIKSSDLIIFLTDIISNPVLDKNLFNILDKINCKKIYVMNKFDLITDISTFYKSYSLKNFIYVSTKTKYGIDVLLEKIRDTFFDVYHKFDHKRQEVGLKVSIIGKPNVGKSSFFNKLINKDVSLVFNQCGTTRDILFNFVEEFGNKYTIADTPGIRKNAISNLDAHFLKKMFSLIKSSDIVLFISDINFDTLNYDIVLINNILKFKKNLIFIFNKSDLLKISTMKFFYLSKIYNFIVSKNIPYRFISSKYGFGIKDIFTYLNTVHFIKGNFDTNNFFNSIKNIFLYDLSIKKIDVLSYYPFSIDIYTNKKMMYNYKKYISSFFFKNNFLKNIPIRLIFK